MAMKSLISIKSRDIIDEVKGRGWEVMEVKGRGWEVMEVKGR